MIGPELCPSDYSKIETLLVPSLCLLVPRKLLQRSIQAWPSSPGLTVGSGTDESQKDMLGLAGWVDQYLVPRCLVDVHLQGITLALPAIRVAITGVT